MVAIMVLKVLFQIVSICYNSRVTFKDTSHLKSMIVFRFAESGVVHIDSDS